MKKTIALLLAVVLCLSLYGCGKTQQSDGGEADATTTTEAAEDTIVEFTDVVLVDNDDVKIELVNFYAEDCNWTTGKQNEKVVTFKATNKTDHEILLNPDKFYIGDEEVYVSMTSGSITPDPGKSGLYSFLVAHQGTPEHVALESFDPLYELEGSFSGLHSYEDSSNNRSLEVDFSIKNSIGGSETTTVAAEEKPATIYKVGDTVTTDIAEFTLTGFNYVYHLDPKTYSEKDDISGGSVGPGTDMVFANPEYTIKNIAKEAIEAHSSVEFTVDYNDGYLFNMYDKVSYIVDAPGVSRQILSANSNSGASMEISPLSSEGYDAYIPANELIDTDNESALLLIVKLVSSNGTEEFTFKIK